MRSVTLPTSVGDLNKHFVGDSSHTALQDLRSYARSSPESRFYFKYIDVYDVLDAVSSARSNAQGSDGIPLSHLKMTLYVTLPVLVDIFNCSLQSRIFPSSWKHALVRPLAKKNNPVSMGDFRPISILCAPSKLLESVAHKQLEEFVSNNSLLDPLQSGFRANHSTQTALINIVDEVREAIDKGKITLLIAIDYSRAFDLVNIPLLVEKLKYLGISDAVCNWIKSFLVKREQVVVAPSCETSVPLARTLGVPQGSLFGPPLFSLFGNDAPSVLRHCKHHFYADDLTIYYHGHIKQAREILRAVNEDLGNLATWATNNGLTINASKTKAIWFCSRGYISRLNAIDMPQPVVGGQMIEVCESVKILGVLLDSTLSWRDNCNEVSRKCFGTLARLRRCNDSLTRDCKLMLVKTLVFPHLDYCSGLFLDLSAELTLKLSRCKNAALRFVTNTRKSEHITPIYKALKIMPYATRRNYNCMVLLATVLKAQQPHYLSQKFSFRMIEEPGSKRRSTLDLKISLALSSSYRFSFAIGAANLWNQLPVNIRESYKRPCF